jgi:hypothetical protein
MARIRRAHAVNQTFVVTCGASNADNLVDAVVPGDRCKLLGGTVTTKTAGTGTGSFSVQIKYEEATPVAVNAATATTYVDADAAAGTIHGSGTRLVGGDFIDGKWGEHLNVTTVKTGTVSGDAVLIVNLLWEL